MRTSRHVVLAALLGVGMVGCGEDEMFFPEGQPVEPGVFASRLAPEAEPGQLVVKSRAGRDLRPLLARFGQVEGMFTADSNYYLLQLPNDRATATSLRALSAHRDVEVATPNLRFQINVQPNDPLYAQQWWLDRVHAEEAWESGMGRHDLIVSVVDTGIDYNHPDLAGKVIKGKDFTKESDGTDPIDGFGHGTHVAGIIGAAANNGEGVAGMAPGVKLLAEKVLAANGAGNLFAIAGGITDSVKRGAKIINLSLGGPAVQDPISSGVGHWAWKKGVLLVAAAGNSNTKVGTPARYYDYYMAVGASDHNDNKAKFSNFGPELSVAAPGTNILATTPTYDCPLNKLGYAKNYAALQGTSMATPVVAGIAALVWSKHPDWTADQVRAHIEKTADDVGARGKDDLFGFGVVNAARAVK